MGRTIISRSGNEVPAIKGSELCKEDQNYVLNAYVHRFTRNHTPNWAKEPRPDGTTYPVQFDSDKDWLENTFFAVTKTGRLNRAFHSCESHATWPDNPELRKQ